MARHSFSIALVAGSALILFVAAGAGGCRGEPGVVIPDGSCTPGAQVACACPAGKSSIKVCLADGSGFGSCQACPNGGTGGGGGAGGGGACQEPFTTPHDCGKCGALCEPQHVKGASCAGGKCIYLGGCAASYQDCDGKVDNGCESDKLSDALNCGACGSSCSDKAGPLHANTPLCIAGLCDYTSCVAPYADCDGNRVNGCESDTKSDPANCGGCTLACKPQHVESSSCADSKCGYSKCSGNFQDCDGDKGNGCESDSKSDKNNCGMCGKACTADQYCFDGVCSDGLPIKVEGHADVLVKCKPGDFSCQAQQVCEKVTGYPCTHQQYDCYTGSSGSWYPEDGQSGSSNFNFAYAYDFGGGNSDYGNICACNSGQMGKYGLASNHQYCGLGHWQRVP